MIVAITGANGFIGQHLERRFVEGGATVRPLMRRDLHSERLDQLFDEADVIVHAAGATRAPTRAILRESNVALTRRVLAAAQRANVGRFVFVSSQAAAGPASFRDIPVTEEMSPSPIEAYGRSKLDAETLIRESGYASWTIVRPAAVYGPGDRDFLALFRLARFGVAVHPGNREQWVSIVHVREAVDGIIRVASDTQTNGGTFFLANDEPVQWSDLFRLAAASHGKALSVDIEVPTWLTGVAALFGDLAAKLSGKAGLLTSEKVALSKPNFWICSNERAKRELGFAPRISLEEGFAETREWYRANGWL